MTRVDWEVVTAVGRTVYTSDSEDMAKQWLKARRGELPGAVVERVERSEVRTRVYTPRVKRASDAVGRQRLRMAA